MSGLFKFFSTAIDVFRGVHVMSRWRDEKFCRDFQKVTIPFAGKQITINQRYQPDFAALDVWITINNLDQYITRVDSFACRMISATSPTWSYHSFGQAIDINPTQFPAETTGRYALPQWYNELLNLARTHGFRCGADWTSYYDPMHIEIGSKLR